MHNVVVALSLLLVFEGLLPLLSPGAWRTAMRRVGGLRDGQIRFVGLASVASGVLLALLLS